MKHTLLFLLFAIHVNSFTLDRTVVWVIDQYHEPEAVQLALRDLKRDWYSIIGYPAVILSSLPSNYTASTVLYLGEAAKPFVTLPQTSETFGITVTANYIAGAGTDLRGTIYALYSISEKLLGVQPFWWWASQPLKYQGSISLQEHATQVEGPPVFELRSLFTNDEDLLSYFGYDPLGESVFSVDIFDKIYESLLRLKMNYMLVGTVPLPDERSLQLASKRGIVVGNHHFNLLGLDTFRWPSGVPFSFGRSKEVMEWMWKANIEAQLNRGGEMVWTIGYRGLNDHPFWIDDPGYNTDEERGHLMTQAIGNQSALLRSLTKQPKQVTFFWDEASDLYYKGFLKFPKDVTLLWTDDGRGNIVAGDKVVAGSGLYYHVAMYSSEANQLTEGVHPTKILNSIQHMVKRNATAAMILNTSDLRPVLMTTWWVAQLIWDMAGTAKNGIITDDTWTQLSDMTCFTEFAKMQYGDNNGVSTRIANWWQKYYTIGYLADVGENFFPTWMNAMINGVVIFNDIPGAAGIAHKDACGSTMFNSSDSDLLLSLVDEANNILIDIPNDRQEFFTFHSVVQIQTQSSGYHGMFDVCNAIYALEKKDTQTAKNAIQSAIDAFDALFAVRRRVEQTPRWTAMFIGDHLSGYQRTYQNLQRFMQYLDKKAVTPMGALTDWYYHFYDYQCDRLNQYPDFYQTSNSADAVVRVTCSLTQSNQQCWSTPYGGEYLATAILNMTIPTFFQSQKGLEIHYTINGTNPTTQSPKFDPSNPPHLTTGNAIIRATLFDPMGEMQIPQIPSATLWRKSKKAPGPPNVLSGEYGGKCPQGNH